jgi:hypothetical protein
MHVEHRSKPDQGGRQTATPQYSGDWAVTQSAQGVQRRVRSRDLAVQQGLQSAVLGTSDNRVSKFVDERLEVT